MKKHRLWLIGQAVLAAGLVLFGFWRLLLVGQMPVRAQAESQFIREQTSAPPTPEPDLLWLELVKSRDQTEALAAQAGSLSINLNLTDQIVAGRVPFLTPVMVTVLRKDQLVGSKEILPIPDAGGGFYQTTLKWYDDYASYEMNQGDEIRVEQAGPAISVTVPDLTGYADSSLEQVFGQAPAGAALDLYLFPDLEPTSIYTATGTADGSGQYRVEWINPGGVKPRDQGYVIYTPGPDRQIYARYRAPYLRAQIYGNVLSGYLAPNDRGTFDVIKPDGRNVQYSVSADSDGYFFFSEDRSYWYDIQFSNEVFTVGDRIVFNNAAQTISMTIQDLTVQMNVVSSMISGQAPINQPVTVAVWSGPVPDRGEIVFWDLWRTSPAAQVTVTASSTGFYNASLPISAGDYGAVSINDAQGYDTFARFTDPLLSAALGYGFDIYFQGQVNLFNANVDVQIIGPSGYLKDVLTGRTRNDGTIQLIYSDYYDYPFIDSHLRLEGGDILRVTAEDQLLTEFTIPNLTAAADFQTSRVSGQAPPDSALTVLVADGQITNSLTVTATANGDYLADFSHFGGFSDQSTGEVVWQSPQGHLARRLFGFWPACPPHPSAIQVSGDQFYLNAGDLCTNTSYQLLDSNGFLKTDQVIQSGSQYFQFVNHGYPVAMSPGDQLVIHSLEGELSIRIPDLSLQVAQDLRSIRGTAPPGITVEIEFFQDKGTIIESRILSAITDSNGIYTATLPGNASILPGDKLIARISRQGIEFFANGGPHFVRPHLYGRIVEGIFAPAVPYTITQKRDADVLATLTGYTGSDGSFRSSFSYLQMPGDRLTVQSQGQVYSMTVPKITLEVNLADISLSGQAPSNSQLLIRIASVYPPVVRQVTVGADGTFETAFDGLAPLQYFLGSLLQYTDLTYQTQVDFTTPVWKISLGSTCIEGNGSLALAPYTATLTSASTSVAETHRGTTSISTSAYAACFGQTFQSGDRYQYEDPSYKSDVLVPMVTVSHDFGQQVMRGLALPNSDITVEFFATGSPLGFWTFQGSVRHTLADVNGAFGLDTSDLALAPGQYGEVTVMDPSGNTIKLSFRVDGYRQNLPFLAVEP